MNNNENNTLEASNGFSPGGDPGKNGGVKIVAFLCNWCSYAGADAAGTSRLRQPENIRIIRLPCSGRVNPLFIIKAFNQGADGVLVSGCHPNDCHYSEGNFYARRRLEFLKEFLPFIGIDKRRFSYQWVSASEAQKWQNVVINFVKRIEDVHAK
ncbi:MAG: hydrogenase iron-sulfur subunit [Actinobacteria bacterium]|nr:hydrogenase iron-sulfur subunit [Actinomycetota bacterium]